MSGARYGCMADASMPALAEQIVMLPLYDLI